VVRVNSGAIRTTLVDIRCTTGGFAGDLGATPAEPHPGSLRLVRKLSMYPNVIVPLQIERAIGVRRYLSADG
jgi:hypothetical protein